MPLTEKEVKDALSEIYDPELGIDIISMGLIYKVEITKDSDVKITMTLTFPGCPYGPSMIDDIEDRIRMIPSVRNVIIDLTFEPPWSPDSMDPDIKAALNLK
jgi:metal-sulfur cluster biosynthetic enzyme